MKLFNLPKPLYLEINYSPKIGKCWKSMLALSLLQIAGCAGTNFQVAEPPQSLLLRAANEIQTSSERSNEVIGIDTARGKVEQVNSRVQSVAQRLCLYLGERARTDCGGWTVSVSSDPGINAYATGERAIVLHRELIEHTKYDDELAFVLAHELSHHMLDHINESIGADYLGQLLGAVAAAIVINELDVQCRPNSNDCDWVADALETGSDLGGWVSNQVYSRSKEQEADLMAAYILSLSGFSLIRARGMLVYLAKSSDDYRLRSTFFDTHPAGAERLAQFDLIIEDVQTNFSGMPSR